MFDGTSHFCADMKEKPFDYCSEKFADLQLLRYRVDGFEQLTLQQKQLIYYLQEAALWGRDILFDQNGRYNLRIRYLLETVYTQYTGDRTDSEFMALEVYLKRVWFSNGIHHHYAYDKFVPGFSPDYLRKIINQLDATLLPLAPNQTLSQFCDEIFPVIFDGSLYAKRVNQAEHEDLLVTSASNYYRDVSQAEAEAFYAAMKSPDDDKPVMFGLNSRLVRENGQLQEKVWKCGGLYGAAIDHIVYWLEKAESVAENEQQREVIRLLVQFYRTGDLKVFDDYSIAWVNDNDSMVDFNNGFIETYGDPLGLKASWESIVNFKNLKATFRAESISANAQWFEDHSPVDPRFKKEQVRGVSAKVITAAILAGDLYPASAIGINLPNSNWIRSEHGSKSVTIGNLTEAYNKASQGNGFMDEFVESDEDLKRIRTYANLTDDLHTDLHECVGHGSGKLLPGVDPDALKAYGATIEEARADLFGLYFMADEKMVELGLLPDMEAYKSQYYTYMMNGLMTQLVRIELGSCIEEAHMRNRALIARWAMQQGQDKNVVEWVTRDEKTYLKINDYPALRTIFGSLLAEIQRIKSEGDFEAARQLVEAYAVKIDPVLHQEIKLRYERLHLAPYKGFINPCYWPVYDEQQQLVDVKLSYGEEYAQQMLRYSRDYSALPLVNE